VSRPATKCSQSIALKSIEFRKRAATASWRSASAVRSGEVEKQKDSDPEVLQLMKLKVVDLKLTKTVNKVLQEKAARERTWVFTQILGKRKEKAERA
jgi:hypothetical protein